LGTTPGATTMVSYGIVNNGAGPLVISGITLDALTNCTATATGPGLTTIPAGGSTSFTVSITPASQGIWNAVVHFANNDANFQPAYDIKMQGNADAPDLVVIFQSTPLVDDDPFGISGSMVGAATMITYTIKNNGPGVLSIP